jgi:hypothetical protein
MDDDIKWSFTDRVLQILMGICGFIGMLTPLAIWVSWSEFTFYTVMLIGAAALGSFFLFSWYFTHKLKAYAAQADEQSGGARQP